MIALSVLLVFGTLAWIGVNVTSDAPGLGAGLLIDGRVPWVVLAMLWGGVALGAASLLRGRKLPKLAVLVLEVVPAALVTWYVVFGATLPAHSLTVAPGDPFPAYALHDQDGTLHEHAVGAPRPPALYVFYRGHW